MLSYLVQIAWYLQRWKKPTGRKITPAEQRQYLKEPFVDANAHGNRCRYCSVDHLAQVVICKGNEASKSMAILSRCHEDEDLASAADLAAAGRTFDVVFEGKVRFK